MYDIMREFRFIEMTRGMRRRALARQGENGHFLKVLPLRHPYLGKSWRLGVLLQDRLPAFIEGSLEFVLDIKGRYGRVQHEYMTIEVCSFS